MNVKWIIILEYGAIYLYWATNKMVGHLDINYGKDRQWYIARSDSDDFPTVKRAHPNASLSYEKKGFNGLRKDAVTRVKEIDEHIRKQAQFFLGKDEINNNGN